MKRLLLAAFLLLGMSDNPWKTVWIEWTPPTENDNGTPLTDLDHYNLYAWTESGEWSPPFAIKDRTNWLIWVRRDLPARITITAVSSKGIESEKSNELTVNY